MATHFQKLDICIKSVSRTFFVDTLVIYLIKTWKNLSRNKRCGTLAYERHSLFLFAVRFPYNVKSPTYSIEFVPHEIAVATEHRAINVDCLVRIQMDSFAVAEGFFKI